MKKSRKVNSSKKSEQKKKQSSLTTQKLIDFLIRSAEVQRKLEIIKEMLAEQEQFTPASLFYRLDTARKGYIVERDLQNFINDQNLQFKGSELKMLFGRINVAKQEQAVRLREYLCEIIQISKFYPSQPKSKIEIFHNEKTSNNSNSFGEVKSKNIMDNF